MNRLHLGFTNKEIVNQLKLQLMQKWQHEKIKGVISSRFVYVLGKTKKYHSNIVFLISWLFSCTTISTFNPTVTFIINSIML